MNLVVKVLKFTEYHKNAMEGYADIELLPPGIVIRGVRLFNKNGKRWIRFPAKPSKKPDGSTGWSDIVTVSDKALFRRLEAVIVREIINYVNSTISIIQTPEEKEQEEDIPF